MREAITSSTVRTHVRPFVRPYVHPSKYANVTGIILVYSIHLCQNKVSADQCHVIMYSFFDRIAGSTQFNSPIKHRRGFIFRAPYVARCGYKAILHQRKLLHSQSFSCSGGKRFGRCFLSVFFAGFNPV